MWKHLFALLLMVSAPCLFGGCERADSEGAAKPAGGNKPAGNQVGHESHGKMTESDLENTIRARLNNDARLRDADLDVTANASRNEVTLSGMVETKAMRDRAVELARASHFGLTINDRIEIRQRELSRSDYTEENAREERARARERGETIGDSFDDAWIHTKVVASLAGDSDASQRRINVDVRDKVVTLRGVVQTAEQKVEAERVAKETEGVVRVINQLKVEKTAGWRLGADYA
ncbi:MAG: BON domain-containing protein [Blastocatellia bacterium]